MPSGGGNDAITISARFPGEAGNMRVRFDLLVGQNILGTDENGTARVAGLLDGDVVWMGDIDESGEQSTQRRSDSTSPDSIRRTSRGHSRSSSKSDERYHTRSI